MERVNDKGNFFLGFLGVLASPASATDPVSESLRMFAEAHGITVEEATTDYRKQMVLADAIGEAMGELGDRYAGHTVTKEPMIARVRMTGVDRVASRRINTDVGPITVIFVPGAAVSIKALESVVRSGVLDELVPDASRYHVDVQRGAVVIKVVGDESFRATKAEESSLANAVGVPIIIEVVKTRMRNLSSGPIRSGGRGVNNSAVCTFGFRAYTPEGVPGLITAAHCDDVLRYESPAIVENVNAVLEVDKDRIRFDAGLNRPGFRRHLAAINYGLGGGGYEHEAVHR